MTKTNVPSGISAVDSAWDGFQRGAGYLLYGHVRHGRNLLALHMVRAAIQSGENCVYVTSRRSREVAMQAESIGFDVMAATQSGALRLLRLPSPEDGVTPDVIERTLERLTDVIAGEAPLRVVVEDFTPFADLPDLSRTHTLATEFVDRVCAQGAVAVLALGEPANDRARDVVAVVRSATAGSIHIDIDRDAREGAARIITLLTSQGDGVLRHESDIDLADLGFTPSELVSLPDLANSGDGSARSEEPQFVTTAVFEAADNESAAPRHRADRTSSQRDEGPGGDSAPSPIRYFDAGELASSPRSEEDPLADSDTADGLLAAGHYLEGVPGELGGDQLGELPPVLLSETPEPDEIAAETEQELDTEYGDQELETEVAQPAHRPVEFEYDAPEYGTADAGLEHDAFEACFDRARRAWLAEGVPFVVVGVRVDPAQASGAALPPLATMVRAASPVDSPIAASSDGLRVTVLLSNTTSAGAGEMLQRLRNEVLRHQPDGIDLPGRAIATIVVANGEPFREGSTFLEYAFQSS